MSKQKGRIRVLLGILIVFIIPFLVVSAIFWTKKPDVYVLETLNESPFEQEQFITTINDTLFVEELLQDVKLLFFTDSTNFAERKRTLQSFYEETLNYPEKTFKEPYPVIYFLELQEQQSQSTSAQSKSWKTIPIQSVSDSYLNSELDKNLIHLFDSDNKLRGQYYYTEVSVEKLKKDIQNLLAQTYHKNSKAKRSDRL